MFILFFVIMFNTLFVLSMRIGVLYSTLNNILHGFLLQVVSVALVIYVRPYVAHWTKKGRITRRADNKIKAEIKRDAVFYVVSVLFSLLWGSGTFLNSPALVSIILNFAAAAPVAYVFDWTRKRSLKEKRRHRRAELREQKLNKN